MTFSERFKTNVPSWANTLNSQNGIHGHISKFYELVKQSGYPYYEWNAAVYATADGPLVKRVCWAESLDAEPAEPEPDKTAVWHSTLKLLAETGGWDVVMASDGLPSLVNRTKVIAKRALD